MRAVDEGALLEKARQFRAELLARHLAPEGVVLYLVNLATIERDLEQGLYPPLADTPTFTGQLAAVSCTRAAVERGAMRREALDDARRALNGLRFLMDVTGVRGLMARSLRREPDGEAETLRGRWYRGAEGYRGYRWRGDVSMDQYANGLVPALTACAAAFPERTRRLATDAAAHLLEHGMRLVDPDGRRTRYGDLSPRSALGFNSLAMLTGYAIFALAADLDTDPRWARRRDRLRDRGRVLARARRTNLRLLGITNPSNDLMAANLYRALIPLARRRLDPALPDLRHGLFRTWLRVRGDGNAYLTLTLCGLERRTCEAPELAEALDLLARFPLDKRKRSLDPRLGELPRRWLPGRKLRPLARQPVPIELRPPSSFEWKSSPYRLDGSVMPGWTYSGLDYLAAYWTYRALPPELRRILRGVKGS
ncbi:MAG: hypothetical protein ACE5FG_00525 [Myxococcota bacterium]